MIERQIKLIEHVSKKKLDEVVTTKSLAKVFNVSSRTIQTDIKVINENSGKTGIKIVRDNYYNLNVLVTDEKKLMAFMELQNSQKDKTVDFTNKKDRVNHIIVRLLFAKKPLLSDNLSNEVFISRSQFSVDLNTVKKVLAKYDLRISSKYHNGLIVEGTEQNKRLCIIRENLDYTHMVNTINPIISRGDITNIVVEALNEAQYNISDLTLQNLIVHVEMSLLRLKSDHKFSKEEINLDDMEKFHKEYEIATKIYQVISNRFLLKVDDAEVIYLAINLYSKKIYDDYGLFDSKTNDFVIKILNSVKEKFGLDLVNDIELRVNLTLHIVPLLVRAKNGFQMSNIMLSNIKGSYILAYDVASLATSMIEEEYDVKISDDERGFLTVHFSIAIEKIKSKEDNLKVLIITSNRKSESLLLQYTFQQNFSNLVGSVDVLNLNEIKISTIFNYDAVFTTTNLPNIDVYEHINKINYFMTEKDREIVRQELYLKRDCKPLLKYFDKDMFICHGNYTSKEELLKDMCIQMNKKHKSTYDIYEGVLKREKLGSTVFAEKIALTHPEILCADETVFGVAVLDKPLKWDEVWDEVQIVFLLNIEASKKHELAYLYDFFSEFVLNSEYADKLIENQSFEMFRSIIMHFRETTSKKI